MPPTVSVLIPTYNRSEMVREAIQSVLDQTYSDFEIIVVDDGSTDDTKEVIEAFSDPSIRYFSQENQGRPAARNHTLREAQGEYLAFLDSDDIWLSEKLEKQITYFEANPSVGMICTTYERIFMDGTFISRHTPRLKADVHRQFLWECNIQTSTIMLRRNVVEAIGEFDPFLLNAQDIDYWLRVAHDYPLGEIPETLVKMRMRKSENLIRDPENVLKYLRYVITKNSQSYSLIFRRRLLAYMFFTTGLQLLNHQPDKLGRAWQIFGTGLRYFPLSKSMPTYLGRLIFRSVVPMKVQTQLRRLWRSAAR